MPEKKGREALRGVEGDILDRIAEASTSKEWGDMWAGPLERAAAQGNRDLAQTLVGAGAAIGIALHEAVRGGHGEMADFLLGSGASVNGKDKHGRTPLHVAAGGRKTAMLHLLLLKGADKDVLDDGENTPLSQAVKNEHVAGALALISAGADVNLGLPMWGAMHRSARLGYVDVLRAGIKHGAHVNATDTFRRTPLHVAAGVDTVDILVDAGADIEARDGQGQIPLHLAAFEERTETALALLKHGTNIFARDNTNATPLFVSAAMAGGQSAKMVDLLLRCGADEEMVNQDGQAPLDAVGQWYDGPEGDEDAERVRRLLANAPADRAWRRRGYLVLCRSHPDRLRQGQENSGAHVVLARRTEADGKLAKAEAGGGTSAEQNRTADQEAGGDWDDVVAGLLKLQEEGVFRKIVGYL